MVQKQLDPLPAPNLADGCASYQVVDLFDGSVTVETLNQACFCFPLTINVKREYEIMLQIK